MAERKPKAAFYYNNQFVIHIKNLQSVKGHQNAKSIITKIMMPPHPRKYSTRKTTIIQILNKSKENIETAALADQFNINLNTSR